MAHGKQKGSDGVRFVSRQAHRGHSRIAACSLRILEPSHQPTGLDVIRDLIQWRRLVVRLDARHRMACYTTIRAHQLSASLKVGSIVGL
jgi:hypothetical protein